MGEFHPNAMDDTRIITGMLRNLRRVKSNPKPRWERVMTATGSGSTVAWQICVRFGFDPEEKI